MNVTQPPTDAEPMTREEMEAIFLTLVDCDHFKDLPFPLWFRQKHRKLLGIPNNQKQWDIEAAEQKFIENNSPDSPDSPNRFFC